MEVTPTVWRKVFADINPIGCVMEFRDGNFINCGPIAHVWEDGTHVYVLVPWIARLRSEGEWEFAEGISWKFRMDKVSPRNTTDGCVSFEVPFLGDCKIFPKHLRQLDIERVKGLPTDPERILSKYLSQFESRKSDLQCVAS